MCKVDSFSMSLLLNIIGLAALGQHIRIFALYAAHVHHVNLLT